MLWGEGGVVMTSDVNIRHRRKDSICLPGANSLVVEQLVGWNKFCVRDW